MLKWLKKAAIWALGKDKDKGGKRDKLIPSVRTERVTKKLKESGMSDEDIARLTGQKAKKALERKMRK